MAAPTTRHFTQLLSLTAPAAPISTAVTVAALKPPLELAVEVTDASGVRTRWDPNDRLGGNRPQGLTFSTKRGEGFSEGSVTLARRIDRDYVDLNLFDDIAFFGADGSVAYEGRIGAQPRSFSPNHSISVQCAGWMSHARDRPFTAIYVDRDLSAWQPPSRSRQTTQMAANYTLHPFEATRDTTTSPAPALGLNIQDNWVSPFMPMVEALYDCGTGNTASVVYIWLRGTASLTSSFEFYLLGGTGENTFDLVTGDLWAGTDNAAYRTLAAGRRYLSLEYLHATTPGGVQGGAFTLFAANVAVYGDTGLPLIGSDPMGVAASDVIKDITMRFCPQLDASGVQTTTWPIPHLVFKEPTDPYDAFLSVNAYHLWELGVWENKTLTFGPTDRSDYDWEVRLSDFGVNVDLQGDSTEDLANGIIVNFTDVATGAKATLFPDTSLELQDPNPLNPATRHGLQRWTKINLSASTTSEAAIQIGRAALTEFNAPKSPGTITVTGHIRDRAGHWQQGWKVRAGDTIAITDHPNSSPRLVTETRWDNDSKQMTITVDSANKRLDAVLDRIGTALNAAGLS